MTRGDIRKDANKATSLPVGVDRRGRISHQALADKTGRFICVFIDMKNTPLQDDDAPYRKRAAKHKDYGIEQWSNWHNKWCYRQWYATEKARDQAFNSLTTRTTFLHDLLLNTPIRKVNR